MNRRPIDRAFVHSIFKSDHPGTADDATIEAFADAILALDDSDSDRHLCGYVREPAGGRSGQDQCADDPDLRGQYDGIASFDDLIEFFKQLPNPDKQFAVMPGISHASFQQMNYAIPYHILLAFFSQPEPIYRG